MQADELCRYIRNFVDNHGISEDLKSRLKKLKGEVAELEEAIRDGDKKEIINEAADVAIIAFHVMMICGALPIWSMFLKLCEVAERPHYQKLRERVQNDKS